MSMSETAVYIHPPRPTIGVLLDSLEYSYQHTLWTSMAACARRLDVNLLCFVGQRLGTERPYAAQTNAVYTLANAETVDGIIVVAGTLGMGLTQEAMLAFCRHYVGLPLVSVGPVLQGIPSVGVNNYQGMYTLVSHLIETHHYRHIAFVPKPGGLQEADVRYQAYGAALMDHGLPVDLRLVAPSTYYQHPRAVIDLFLNERRLQPGRDLEAIVAVDDYMAIPLLEELQARGDAIPTNIAVVGFDDSPESRYVMPALTTVRQPVEQLGVKAVETALALLRHEAVPTQVELATELVVRASCGCPAATASPQTADPLEFSALHRADFRYLVQTLLATFNLTDLVVQLADRLPHLGIPAAYLALYADATQARLLAGTIPESGQFVPTETLFPARQLLPATFFPAKQCTLLIYPLNFREELLGFGVLAADVRVRDIHIYEILSSILSSVIKGALLWDAQRAAQRELQAAYAEVEQRVAERTAELQHEITGHRRTAEALAQEQALMRTLMDTTPDHIYFKDRESRFIRMNRAQAQRFGLDAPEEALGKTDFDFFSEEHAQQAYHDEQEIIRTGEPVVGIEEKETWPDGSVSWVLSTKMPLRDETGAIVGTFGISRDITTHKQAEAAMLQSAKMASVGSLAAGVAHEINNPLTAMMQSAQVLEMALDTQRPLTRDRLVAAGINPDALAHYLETRRLREYLSGIRDSGARAAKIVADLLSFSRHSASRIAPHNLNRLLEQTLALSATDYDLNQRYDFRNIDVVLALADNVPEVNCDGQQIQQVILHLLRNAAHAMGAKKTSGGSSGYRPCLSLRTLPWAVAGSSDRWARLEVEDNGPGIPEAQRAHLFEPFITTKEVGEGIGMGLWLCWAIVVERHKGHITLEIPETGGARFVIMLPQGIP